MKSVDNVGSLGPDLNRNGGSDRKKTTEHDLLFQQNLRQVIEADARGSRSVRLPSMVAMHIPFQNEKASKVLRGDLSRQAHDRFVPPKNYGAFETVEKETNSKLGVLDDESIGAKLANESKVAWDNEAGEAYVIDGPIFESPVASADQAIAFALHPAVCQFSKTHVIANELVSANYSLRHESPTDPMRALGPSAELASDIVAQNLPDMPRTLPDDAINTGVSILEAKGQKIHGFMTAIHVDGVEQMETPMQNGSDPSNPAHMTRTVHRLTMTVGSVSDGYVKCDIRKIGEILDIVLDATVAEFHSIRGRESDLKRSLEDIGIAVDNVKVQLSPRSEREVDVSRRDLEHGSYGGDEEAGRRKPEHECENLKPSKEKNINAKRVIEGPHLLGSGSIYI